MMVLSGWKRYKWDFFYVFQLKHECLVEKALKSGLITASKNCCKLSWLIRHHCRVVNVPFSVQRLIKFWPIIFVTRASRDSRYGPLAADAHSSEIHLLSS